MSVKSVTDYLNSNGRKISANTVDDYMDALAEAFIFYPVERFDLVGKQIRNRIKNGTSLTPDYEIIFYHADTMT